jgi:hypothetical protein
MVVVIVAAVIVTLYRAGSFWGLAILVPFGMTAAFSLLERGPWRRRRTLGAAVVGTLIVPFLLAIGGNWIAWGYPLSRPGVDRRIVEALRVETVTAVKAEPDAGGRMTFAGGPMDIGPSARPGFVYEEYYLLENRVLVALSERGTLPEQAPAMTADRLRGLYPLLDATGRLERGEPGYDNATRVDGVAVEANDRDGRPLLFVGLRGGQVSNDHYPFYEFLFDREGPDGVPRLIGFQRFYFDVAGFEGLEWPAFLLVFAWLGLIPTVVLQSCLLWDARVLRRLAGQGEVAPV